MLVPAVVCLLLPVLVPGVSGLRPRPNIVLIVADDLGYNDVPWHNPAIIAPTLQELASDGVVLEQHYVQTKCAPSRAALLSGRYPFHIGRQHESLSPMMPTGVTRNVSLLPEALQQVGYTTHAVGKWHLGYCSWDYTPTRRGFDTFFGFYSHSEDYYNRIASDSTETFKGYDLRDNEKVTFEGDGEYSAELFSRKAGEIIRGYRQNNPFFLYLAFQNVHKPIQVPDRFSRLYQPYGRLAKESKRRGMITALDEAVKNVTIALKEAGFYKDTIIIFLSDNGGWAKESNWPLRGKKNSVYEGGTRGVSFFHYPKLKKRFRGTVSTSMFHIADWFPTILALTGNTPRETGLDGIDQSLHLLAGWPGPRNELVYNINDALRVTAAVRSGPWKLIWGYAEGMKSEVTRRDKATRQTYAQTLFLAAKRGLLQLYDLRSDPNETTNLADTNRTKTKELMRMVRKIWDSGEVWRPDTPLPNKRSLPIYHGGVVSPGWCRAK